MNIRLVLTICLAFATCLLPAGQPPEALDRAELSEALGHLIVRHLAQPGFDLNVEMVMKGMVDEQKGLPSPMSEEEYEQAIYAIQETNFLQTAEENLAKATEFMKANAKEEGMQIVDDGLHYKIAHEGTGEEVCADSTPLIKYKGELIDGTVFANSANEEGPIALPMSQSIPGFTKGLVGMKEGEKRVLYIHPDEAYGTSSPMLPPNSLLIFEVEVVQANALPTCEIVQK